MSPAISGSAPAGSEAFASAVAKDLADHKGRAVVMVGDSQPPAVHALAHAINAAIGAPVTVPADAGDRADASSTPRSRELVSDINAGRVQMLVIIGESNPAYSAPADFNFADAMRKVSLVVHSGLFFDETATLSHWHIPATHYLEAWSDARSIDGTVSIVQPLIQPLYGGKSAHEVIATMTERPERAGYDVVREFWQSNGPKAAAVQPCGGPAAPAAGWFARRQRPTADRAAAAPTAASGFREDLAQVAA